MRVCVNVCVCAEGKGRGEERKGGKVGVFAWREGWKVCLCVSYSSRVRTDNIGYNAIHYDTVHNTVHSTVHSTVCSTDSVQYVLVSPRHSLLRRTVYKMLKIKIKVSLIHCNIY
jgi:hypothetical protein